MATSTKPAICSPPADLFGTGAQFERIPFRSKEDVYCMPKELALPIPPSNSSNSVKPIRCLPSKPHLPGGLSVDLNSLETGKQSCGNLEALEDRDASREDNIIISGIDLSSFLKEVRGESVVERFMREENVIERIWGGALEIMEGEIEIL
ncbi:hypothetical protein IFR05_002306 [Cadophora sp. M221]|nr:hypothetical protein IFR05_002306 [Cadophora sp. M221]